MVIIVKIVTVILLVGVESVRKGVGGGDEAHYNNTR